MTDRVTIKKERTVRVDAELWHTSWCLLKSGQEHKLGCVHQFRGSLVFTAFALEAYLNHLGASLLDSWETIERKLAPKQKLSLLCEWLELDVEWSARPWQTVTALISYRNVIAHGRGDELREEYDDSVDHYASRFDEPQLTKWENYASSDNAHRARIDVEEIVHRLHERGGDPEDYPFAPSSYSGSAGPSKNG